MQKNIYEGDVIVVHQGSEPITVVFPGEVAPISVNITPEIFKDLVFNQGTHNVVRVPTPDLAPVGEDENEIIDLVAGFHERFLHPILPTPQMPTKVRANLRQALMEEELSEFAEAVQKGDLVGVADALCDLQYVLTGTVLEFGMGSAFMRMFREVHGSNMSKACRTREEASATVDYYKERGVEAYPHMIEQDHRPHWLIYRASDDKTLKSVNYQPARLAQFLVPWSPRMKKNPLPFPGENARALSKEELDRIVDPNLRANATTGPMPMKHISAKIPYTKTTPESLEVESKPPVRSLRGPREMDMTITELETRLRDAIVRIKGLEAAEKGRGKSTMEFNSSLSDQLTRISEGLKEGLKRISGIEKFDERLRDLDERFRKFVQESESGAILDLRKDDHFTTIEENIQSILKRINILETERFSHEEFEKRLDHFNERLYNLTNSINDYNDKTIHERLNKVENIIDETLRVTRADGTSK